MRIAFIGSIEFSWHVLKAFIESEVSIVGVWTIDEKFSKNISDYRSLEDLAKAHGISYHRFRKISDPETVESLRAVNPDLLLVMGLSQLIAKDVLQLAPGGVIGSHPTLLPQARGRAAIPWSILKGLKQCGLSFFYLVEEVDAGDVVCQKAWEITEDDTADTLYRKMISAGVELAKELSVFIRSGMIPRKPQPQEAEYWPGRKPEDGLIHWDSSEKEIYDLIRATTRPYPGAYSYFSGRKVIFWEAKRNGLKADYRPGQIVSCDDDSLVVAANEGSLRVTRIGFEGINQSSVKNFIAASHIKSGDRFEKAL